MLTHLKRSGSMSACGKSIPYPEYLTSDVGSVTCGSCVRRGSARSMAGRKAWNTPGHADPDYRGTGVLKCFHCDRPIRDHPKARVCPFPPVMVEPVERSRARGLDR